MTISSLFAIRKTPGVFLLVSFIALVAAASATAQTGSVTLAWDLSTDPTVTGYTINYGTESGLYTSSLDAGLNTNGTVAGLTEGQTYYFAVNTYDDDGSVSDDSNEVLYRVPILPTIGLQPLTQTAIAGTAVTLVASGSGDPPLNYQWMNGLAAIPGATNTLLAWSQIAGANAGHYFVIVSNPWGSTTSMVAILTVLVPPAINPQPQSQRVIATTAAIFSAGFTGTAPLSVQWYRGTTALGHATNAVLALPAVTTANAGSYRVTISNAAGSITSSVATLTVLPTNTIATAAGVYNGLFFQTNLDGDSVVTEATAGLFGNCVVGSNGAFSANVCVGGISCAAAGVFNISGNATTIIPRAGTGLSNLTAGLHVDLINGTGEITGTISSRTGGTAWTTSVVAERATNSYPAPVTVSLVLSPGLAANAPSNYAAVTGTIVNGVLSLGGVLGDAETFSQTVTIAKDGDVPIYANLYTNGGLLAGWINLASGNVTGNLAWIRPGGVVVPGGFPLGFSNVAQVTGATFGAGVGYIGASGPATYQFASTTAATSGWIVFQDASGTQYYRRTGSTFSFAASSSLTFWACSGTNNPTAAGVITGLVIGQCAPNLISIDVSGLASLQTLTYNNNDFLSSVNARGCGSLATLTCNYCNPGAQFSVNNCASLGAISLVSSGMTATEQNAVVAVLPTFSSGTHTLYWSNYAPSNPVGDAAAIAKGWTVNRQGS